MTAALDIDFSRTEEGNYEPQMVRVPSWTLTNDWGQGKMPWMPWLDPGEYEEDYNEYSWSSGDYIDHDSALKRLDSGETDYLSFILQSPDGTYTDHGDPFIMVDFDDVRDQESGEVIQEVVEFLTELGVTFVEVSKSGKGLHAIYTGELPDGYETGISIEFRDAPVFGHDEKPKMEIYDRKRVCVSTGEQVVGSAAAANPIDDAALRQICLETGSEKQKRKNENPEIYDGDSDDWQWEPDLSREEVHQYEKTSEIEDIYDAIAHVRPGDISLYSERTEYNSGRMSFDPSWETSKSGTRLGYDNGWIYRDGNVGIDALMVVALEEGIIHSVHDYPSGKDFWRAIEELRDRGAHIPELDTSNESAAPVSAMDLKRMAALNHQEQRRFARKRGLEWPTTEEARERLRDLILEIVDGEGEAIIDAPTALGKTHAISTEHWLGHPQKTGGQPVVHLHATKEAREQAAEASDGADGVDHVQLKGRHDLCPICQGYHDIDEGTDGELITINGVEASVWMNVMCEQKGLPFSVAHSYLVEHNDQDLDPVCVDGETDCPAIAQWDGVPRDEDDGTPAADLIHATHEFARVPGLIRHTNVVFDERPDFVDDSMTTDRVQRLVTAFLKQVDAPVQTWEEFVQLASFDHDTYDEMTRQVYSRKDELRGAIERTPDREWYFEDDDAHTLAPALAKAVYWALDEDPDANDRRSATVPHEPPRLDGRADTSDGWNRTWVTVVMDEDNRVETLRNAPDLSLARSVVGLDAHPIEEVWQRNTKPDIGTVPLLDDEERRLWRRFERGLVVVQVGDATRPLTSGEYFNERGCRAFLSALRDEYGDDFQTCITAASVESRVRECMGDVGIPSSQEHTMHFGEEKSRNDFGDENVGAINGCIDPGDDYVVNLLAELELDAQPKLTEDGEREHGRAFVGPDADAAEAILASVRETHVAQAAGRYARNAEDPQDTAIVYARTDAMPDGFADVQVPGVYWTASEVQRSIIHRLQEDGGATAKSISKDVDCSKRHVLKTLKYLEGQGVVTARARAGDHGATVYFDDQSSVDGIVDLDGEPHIVNGHVWESYTWSFAVSPPSPARGTRDDPSPIEPATPSTEDDPPDPGGQLTLPASTTD